MTQQPVRADVIVDFSCPWSVIGVRGLLEAFYSAGVQGGIRFQPFELNPELGPQGAVAAQHAADKYKERPERYDAMWEAIREQGKARNFIFNHTTNSRVWNTFDAHRLMALTNVEGKGLELSHALFKANFTEGRSISDHAVLIDCARAAGLDAERARAVLNSDEFGTVVRTKEQAFAKMGVYQTPTVIFNDFWIIPGAQAPQVYMQAIRSILSGEAKPN